jgi:S-formylglutathione hydrolase FrmB
MLAIDVQALQPGQVATVDALTLGYPLKSVRELPAGDYYVQALLNVYTRFQRSDGNTIWAHMDQWEGQQFNKSPGNLFTEVGHFHLDPLTGYEIRLSLDHKIPTPLPPGDTQYVKHIKIQSKLLTQFWGQPVYLGATVLLPEGYETHPAAHYPVLYEQGHFSLRAPLGFANSANNGPYGDAIMNELIPYVEEHFRIIRQPYARVLSGGSTGGWESLALQVYHPDFFGGTWTFYPDPVDFTRYGIVDIYNDVSAFLAPNYDPPIPERPMSRTPEGQMDVTVRQMSQLEEVLGSHGRSGQQFEAWEAVYGPVGVDGYPKPLWDKTTGKIDPTVANYMREHGYDLRSYLEQNWATIGPKLVGKLHLYCGDMDNFYLNLAVYKLEDALNRVSNPRYGGSFEYGRPMKGHGWTPLNQAQLLTVMANHITLNALAGADKSWKY